MMTNHSADDLLDSELTELHDSYIWLVNASADDESAREVAQQFPDEALALLSRSR